VRSHTVLTCVFALAFALPAQAQVAEVAAKQPAWIERSNSNSALLIDAMSQFNPEDIASDGLSALDAEIIDLKPKLYEREKAAFQVVLSELKKRSAVEKDPAVQQDLQILIGATEQEIEKLDIYHKYKLPYISLPELLFYFFNDILSEQSSPERKQAALVRLRKYTGLESGYTPITTLLEASLNERRDVPGILYPSREELLRDVTTSQTYIDDIEDLFKKSGIKDYQTSFEVLKRQLLAHNEYLRTSILPRARTDFRLPRELYAFRLKRYGMEVSPEELATRGHQAFKEIQQEMQNLAPKVAAAKGYPVSDYRGVVCRLKQERLEDNQILDFYKQRQKDLEAAIREHKIVTLPQRSMIIRLASPGEAASGTSAYFSTPPILNNKGRMGELIIPLQAFTKGGAAKIDDYRSPSRAWTLMAHEGRPGHDLQFATIIENGISFARGYFAYNAANVEGWGVYSEALMLPYMPLDGQLISLDARLQRAARAFLDPELQSGKISPQEAERLLVQDVCFSDALAHQEVERYTVRTPGQATAYFYGYWQLTELRADVEKQLGKKFDQQKFHDFILQQGMLPHKLLRKVVLEEFVKPQLLAEKVRGKP
jgi:Bacterial protein of unknown function (DUF885)